MTIQLLNLGTSDNDGTGDSLKDGGTKINFNFQEIYNTLGDGETLFSRDVNLGQIKLLYSNSVADETELSTINPQLYPGLLIHVRSENAIYYASGFSWIKILSNAEEDITNYTDSLSAVAYSGSYNDLIDTPVVPTDLSELTDNSQIYARRSSVPVRITDLSIEDGVLGQVLVTNGNGTFEFKSVAGSESAIGLTDLTVSTTSANGAGALIYNSLNGEFTFTPPNLAIYATIGSLETVASTGDYNDLFSTPDLSVYALSSELHPVATSGDYDDLINSPSIPNNTSDLNNDAEFISLNSLSVTNAQPSGAGSLVFNGSNGIFTYTPPDIAQYLTLTELSALTSQTPAGNGQLAYNNELGIFTFTPPDLTPYATSASLATVATTGSFTDLLNKPTTIAGYGISDAFGGSYVDLTNKPTIPAVLTDLGITEGTTGQILSTNGAGTYTFIDPAAGGGLSATRVTEAKTTESIAQDATANIEFTTLGISYNLYTIQVDGPAWIRIYTDTASRTADAGRAQGVDPAEGSGVVAEVISGAASTFKISPAIIGYVDDSETSIPVAVTNLDAATGTVTVTLTVLKLEE